MKWLLLAILIFLIASGRGKLAALFSTARKLPKEFDDGKKRVEDPAMAARDVSPPVTPSGGSEPPS